MMKITKQIKDCLEQGRKLLICGNGGSSAETEHFVSEFITHGFSAISLNNPAVITAIANDYSYEEVFSKQVEVIGRVGDVLIGLSTSGKSKNILKAYKVAKENGLTVIDWPRKFIPKTPKGIASIQEYQLKLMHKVYLELIKFYK